MKQSVLTFMAIIIFTCSLIAGDAPVAAENALSEKFPKAEEITWQKESANNFRADFILSGVKIQANFNQDGKWILTKTAIPVSDLPSGGIRDFMKKNYPGGSVQSALKVERPTTNGILYEVEIKAGDKVNMELLTADGRKFQ